MNDLEFWNRLSKTLAFAQRYIFASLTRLNCMSGYSFRLCSLVFERKVFPFREGPVRKRRQMLTSDEELRIFRTQSIVLCEYVNAIPSIHHDHIFQDDDESEAA